MAGLLVEVIAQAHRESGFAAGLAENDRRQITGVARLIHRLREAGLADPGLREEEAARSVLTLTDSFLGRGYPSPIAIWTSPWTQQIAIGTSPWTVAQEMIARVLRRFEIGEIDR